MIRVRFRVRFRVRLRVQFRGLSDSEDVEGGRFVHASAARENDEI